MVSTVVACPPSVAPPVGPLSVRFTVSFPSTAVSLTIGTVNVLVVSPSANVRVPVTPL